jgi:hypothetical protein
MNNTEKLEITWKRQPDGKYVGRHGFWVYTVYRDKFAARSRQWRLEGYPEGNPEAVQVRTSFDSAYTAKQAALHTNCFICGRHVPFGTLEPHHFEKSRNWMAHSWRCRDIEPCQAERARLTAERHEFELAGRRTDHEDIHVREDEYGPQLVFRSGNHGTVVNVTEADLDAVAQVVSERRGPQGTTANVRHWLLAFEEAHHRDLSVADELHLSKVRALISKFPVDAE